MSYRNGLLSMKKAIFSKSMYKIILLFLSSLFFLTARPQETKLNSLTDQEKKEGWELLFNGKNLNGWKIFQGRRIGGWSVSNGILSNSGIAGDQGGDLITRDKFQSFELYLEWKVSPQGNSGIFYHVNEKIGKAIYESGPEYQILDDKGWPEKLRDYQYSGSIYGMNVAQNAVVENANQWNQSRIIVDGTHVQHFLNGAKVVDYHLWDQDWFARKEKGKWRDYPYYGMAKKGAIGLQDNGGLVQFRNIKIRVIK